MSINCTGVDSSLSVVEFDQMQSTHDCTSQIFEETKLLIFPCLLKTSLYLIFKGATCIYFK